MVEKRSLRWALLAIVCVLLVFSCIAGVLRERRYCMAVPLMDRESIDSYAGETKFGSVRLMFNGETVAMDNESNTIYVSQSSEKISEYWELDGSFSCSNNKYSLWFLRDEAIENISRSTSENIPLTLILTDGSHYQQFQVIISTLPVFKIDGKYSFTNEDDRPVYSGRLTFWEGSDSPTESYNTVTSAVEYHVRGYSTAGKPKNPWKLSLKDENGGNKDIDFLGMGADDDWILNSLTMDDTKLREKLFMDLWNDPEILSGHKYKMSVGEYVEVVINGEYMGLYLLQRRVDAKYLELDPSDVLLKVTNYRAGSVQEAYEFITEVNDPEAIYAVMDPVFHNSDGSSWSLNSAIDTNLFLNFSVALDNIGLKNMFIVLEKTGNDYVLFFVPWDTDMSFGLRYENKFVYNFDSVVHRVPFRSETDAVRNAYDQYDSLAKSRWSELRQTVLTEESLIARIDSIYCRLDDSGAWERDIALWGVRYKGQDTVDNLKEFVKQKLVYLDEYYGE